MISNEGLIFVTIQEHFLSKLDRDRMPPITVGSYPIPRRGVYTVSYIATVPILGHSNRISFDVDSWS